MADKCFVMAMRVTFLSPLCCPSWGTEPLSPLLSLCERSSSLQPQIPGVRGLFVDVSMTLVYFFCKYNYNGGRGEVEKYEHLLGSSLSSSIKIRRPTFPFPGSLVPDPYAAPEIYLGFFLLRWGQAPRQVGTGEESCA